MKETPDASASAERHIYTRLPEILEHIPWYAFQAQARLAADVGTSRSTINRLIHNKCVPSIALILAIHSALKKRSGRAIPMEEWISLDNSWPTEHVCTLFDCKCLPERAYNADGTLKPAFAHIKPGTWTAEDYHAEEV